VIEYKLQDNGNADIRRKKPYSETYSTRIRT